MQFDIINGSTSYSDNALKSGNRLAANHQSPAHHAAALNKYIGTAKFDRTPMGLLKRQIDVMKGKAYEKSLPQYWDDKYPRRPITQSSSWIQSLNYNPTSKVGTIRYGNKDHSKYMTDYDSAQFVNAPSIGKLVHQKYMP
jgi:hypothetical protein